MDDCRSAATVVKATRPLLALAAVFVVAGGASASTVPFDFKTPGEAAYCRLEFSRRGLDALRCVRPDDGFWIRLVGLAAGTNARVTKGHASRYRGHRERTYVLAFGRKWISSDAEIVACRSRRSGLTCKHPPSGLSFWLGRRRGSRVFYAKPGYALRVVPFFRTASVWCGLNRDTLEPDNPYFLCWHPASGLLAGVAHHDAGAGAGASRSEQALGFRPRGFRVLRPGGQFTWRCRSVTVPFSAGCSTRIGRPVFTCRITAVVRCANMRGRGFWIGPRGGFETF
jgi:hypothetical protein